MAGRFVERVPRTEAFDAPFSIHCVRIHLKTPVNGYGCRVGRPSLLVPNGGIFDYGDAPFHGSAGSLVLNKPIVGMAPDYATGGYWLLGSDGGIFSYDAPFPGWTGAADLPGTMGRMNATTPLAVLEVANQTLTLRLRPHFLGSLFGFKILSSGRIKQRPSTPHADDSAPKPSASGRSDSRLLIS